MNRVIYENPAVFRPHTKLELGKNVFCFECGCAVHDNDDAHVCIECGGCSLRLESPDKRWDTIDKWIERIGYFGMFVCIAVAIKVRLFP